MAKIKTTSITNISNLQQVARQINENFGRVTRVMNTPQTVQIYYDNNHTLPRLIIGQIPDTRKQIIAISKEGTDVLQALSKSPIDEQDFIFSTEIIDQRTERLEETVDVVTEALEIEQVVFETIEAIFKTIEGIDEELLSTLEQKIAQLHILQKKIVKESDFS